MERIDKLLASSGKWTRKEAKSLISQGRVFVNQARVTDCQEKFPLSATISVDGLLLRSALPLWLMLHKPQGYVTATSDPVETTVMELLPPDLAQRVFPVGRLDKDTEGLLLFTDDGDGSHKLLSPKKSMEKVYYAELEGRLAPSAVEAVAEGLILGDGLHCLPAKLEILEDGFACRLTLTQGKFHQVKRMLACLNAPVRYLKRERIGGLFLDETLALGEWRALTLEEISIMWNKLGG